MIDPQDLDALIFDTGGTLSDWHTAVKSPLETVGAAPGLEADCGTLTKTWRRRWMTMVDVGYVDHIPHMFVGSVDPRTRGSSPVCAWGAR